MTCSLSFQAQFVEYLGTVSSPKAERLHASMKLSNFSQTTWIVHRPPKQKYAEPAVPELAANVGQIPILQPTFSTKRYGITKLRATWLGHSCFLVEFPSGLRALFDPVFTDRCSPFSWFGPKRFTKLPCQIADIPIIDVVVISHDHYDHVRN